MQKITHKDFIKLIHSATVPRGYRDETEKAFIQKLKACKIAEGILIERKEWPRKASFLRYFHWMVRREKIDKKFTVRTIQDGTGWAVLRVK